MKLPSYQLKAINQAIMAFEDFVYARGVCERELKDFIIFIEDLGIEVKYDVIIDDLDRPIMKWMKL